MKLKQNLKNVICKIADKYSVNCKFAKMLNEPVIIIESKDIKADKVLVYARNQIYNACMKYNEPMLVFDYNYEDRELTKSFTILENLIN